jgi:trans-AT polyketide synthase/acyltransferase/oxidoreductase domain-containing protein
VRLTPQALGSTEFRHDYGLAYAYLAGGMYRAIASVDLAVRMGRAGMLGFFGTAGLPTAEIGLAIQRIQRELPNGEPYGINLVHNLGHPDSERDIIELCLRHRVRVVEASAFVHVTPALVKYRAKGLRAGPDGRAAPVNRIIAKLSRPEVARAFLAPAPEPLLQQLMSTAEITAAEAALARTAPVADDICVEADSGGHTDKGVLTALFPVIRTVRDELSAHHSYSRRVRVGAAGGLGSAEAIAATFVLGADFVLTGSVNQCTVEAGISAVVKDMLQKADVNDTTYAPAGDMFELGAQVQVLQKGTFFPGRANRLFQIYRQYSSLDDIDPKTRRMMTERYFKCDFDEVWAQVRKHQPSEVIDKAQENPKHKLALLFKWYFAQSTKAALCGDPSRLDDYQIHCGPALGTFNYTVRGTPLHDWRHRHVDDIGIRLMSDAAELLNQRFAAMFANAANSGRAPRALMPE